MPRGSGHPDLSQRPRRESPGMLTGLAILERELGLVEYSRHQVRRKLAAKPTMAAARTLRRELRGLAKRRVEILRRLDAEHAAYEERLQRAMEGIRARAARSPPTRRESREEAQRRLGIPRRP